MVKYIHLTRFLLLFGLFAGCGSKQQPVKNNMLAQFIKSQKLENYPSGSTISYYNDRFYVMGDDASSLLILDTELNVVQEIPLFTSQNGRIAKADKADIEASDWIIINGKPKLWLFSSGSLSPQRDSAFWFEPETGRTERISFEGFHQKLTKAGIAELNIEAATTVNNSLLLGSRGNTSNPQNYLVKTLASDVPGTVDLQIIHLNLPDQAGISGMFYLEEEDILLVTTSTEETDSSYDDGLIGASSLGFVYNISEKLSGDPLTPTGWINLPALHADFEGQKIESVSAHSSEAGEIIATLVSDDDKGGTRLFRLKLIRDRDQ